MAQIDLISGKRRQQQQPGPPALDVLRPGLPERRCVGALILWAVACYALALSARCLMYGKCPVLTPPPSFPE